MERFWSIVTTCTQQGKPVIDFLYDCVYSGLNNLPSPSLLQGYYPVTTNTLLNNHRIEPFEFCASIGCGELPIDPPSAFGSAEYALQPIHHSAS
jgi:hypothetical protein